MGRTTPTDYIQRSVLLHLSAQLKNSSSLSELKRFVDGDVDGEGVTRHPRLFVWVPPTDGETKGEPDEEDEALCSVEQLDGRNVGALAFINSSLLGEMDTTHLQCVLLTPRSYGEEKQQSTTTTFASLQMFARHVFLPAVRSIEKEEEGKSMRAVEGLEDRLHELDVALGQCRRTVLGTVPTVNLRSHPLLIEAAAKISGKIDLDALGLTKYLEDDAFLNEVQTTVNSWIGQIRKVTGLTSTPFPSGDSAETESHADLDEISFWMGLEEALKHIREELDKPENLLTVVLLKAAKRFVATAALENNTGLDAAETQTTDICAFLKQYPAAQLAASRDWDKISTSVTSIFDHLQKVRQCRFYDLDRLARLVEASTMTLRERIEGTLRERYGGNGIVLQLSYKEYESMVRGPTQDVFVVFDAAYGTFKEFFLEMGRTRRAREEGRNETPAMVLKGITLYHLMLRERLESVYQFRMQHEKLRGVVLEVLTGEKGKKGDGAEEEEYSAWALREVDEAPMSLFASVDVLDLSSRGETAFASALEGYDRKVDAIEERLARLLRDKLAACQDAEDMFRVFARFSPLLTRSRVRAAVKEFQIQLMDTVGKAVEKLQLKFTQKYESSPASTIASIRGIPPVSGKILWAKQMERQVHALMKRMSDVLGREWGQQLEGRQLRRSCDELLSKLDSRAYFRNWVSEWERELSSDTSSKLSTYPIVIVREGSRLVAKANFDEKHEYLSREIRYLKWLGYERDIPRTITTVAEDAMAKYPHASKFI
jgi:dynein heavy chain 1